MIILQHNFHEEALIETHMRGSVGEAKGLMLKYVPSFHYFTRTGKWCIHIQEIPLLIYYCKKYGVDLQISDRVGEMYREYREWASNTLEIARKQARERPFTLQRGNLYPFQQIGASAAYMALQRFHGYLIGDAVGLGKTPQALAVATRMLEDIEVQGVLVMSRAVAKYSWQEEIQKFTNSNSIVIDGTKQQREALWKEACFARDTYTIANYDLLIRDPGFMEYVSMLDVLLIYDEIQMLKNQRAKRSAVATQLTARAHKVLGLSASFYEINPFDTYGIWRHIDPYVFGLNANRFAYHFVELDFWGSAVGIKKRKLFTSKLKPNFVRRLKEEVQDDLPEIVYASHAIQLEDKQYKLYNQIKEEAEDGVDNPLTTYGKLLRVVNAPNTLPETEGVKNTKLEDLLAFIEDLGEKDRVVIFSHYVDPANAIAEGLEKLGVPHITVIGQEVPTKERFARVKKFENNPDEYKVLVATDVLRESHNIPSANVVINYDIPYNPQHLVQRVGRLDRITQKHDKILVVSIYARNTIEEKIYKKMYDRLEDGTFVMDGGETEDRVTMTTLRELLS